MLNAAWLSLFSVLSISGPEAEKFLQGQLTTDVTALSEHQTQLTAHCNPQGRMVSLGYLIRKNSDYLYFLPKEIAELSLKHLRKFILRSKVTLTLLPSSPNLCGLWGDLPASDKIIKIDDTRGFYLSDTPSPLELSVKLNSEADWLQNQIKHRTAWLTAATQEKLLPDEIKLSDQQGVCLTKGCFIGQEIIARMHYRGHSKNQVSYQTSSNLTLRPLDHFSSEQTNQTIICQIVLNQTNHCLILSKN